MSAGPRTRVRVTFKPSGIVAEGRAGVSLLDLATDAGVHIDAPCGGQGRCGRCKVQVRRRGRAASGGHSPERRRRRRRLCPRVPDLARRRCRGHGAAAEGARTAAPRPRRSRAGGAPADVRLAQRPGGATVRPRGGAALSGRQHQRLRPPPAGADPAARHQGAARGAAHAAPPRQRPPHGQLERPGSPRDARLGLRHVPAAQARLDPSKRLPPEDDGPRRRCRHHVRRRLPRRLRDGACRRHGQRLQPPDRLRRRRHLAHHLRETRRRTGPAAAARRRDRERPHRRAEAAQQGRDARDPRGGGRRQHDHDAPAPRARPALPARGALHPDRRRPAQARRRRARPRRQPARPRPCPAVGGQLRRRRHHRRRHLVRPVRDRQADRLHRHRDQRRDGARHERLARRLRLLGGPRLRGRRRALRHARDDGRHRGRLDRLEDTSSRPSRRSMAPRRSASAAAGSSTSSPSSSRPASSTRAATSAAI